VFSVSATTRAPRTGEVDGVHYHFVTPERFREMQREGAFIESAEVHGNLYGTLREPMERALAAGRVFLVEIDVQGALQLKALRVPGVYVFIDVPDIEELRRRLANRGTDTAEVVRRRIQKVEAERIERDKYDHVVVNRDLEQAIAEVRRIAGLETSPEGVER
jgi:guanylate kinase